MFHAWNAPLAVGANQNGAKKSASDPFRLARYYQSLLDSGKFENRAELARFLGVSRARETQVLRRLDRSNGLGSCNEAGDCGPAAAG